MKRMCIILGSIIGGLYLLFLVLPLIISPFLNSYSPQISTLISEATGFGVKLEKIAIITTPKLTVGLKVGNVECKILSGDNLVDAKNIRAKLSLIPLLARRIELDKVSADSINLDLKFRQDGHLLMEEYLPVPDPDAEPQPIQPLPFGFKLSNKLPDVVIKNYNVALVDMRNGNKYSINGPTISISNFVLDKSVKLLLLGQFDINSNKQFAYDVKLNNKLMPKLSLNDMVFAPAESSSVTNSEAQFFNVLPILSALKNIGLSADLVADIQTKGTFNSPEVYGHININDLTLKSAGKFLPKSYVKILANKQKIHLDSNLYSNENELTTLVANFKKGKKLDLSLKSNANIGSLVKIINSMATAFGINELKTLSANGVIDADFNVSATKKKVKSHGHLNLPSGNIAYKLY